MKFLKKLKDFGETLLCSGESIAIWLVLTAAFLFFNIFTITGSVDTLPTMTIFESMCMSLYGFIIPTFVFVIFYFLLTELIYFAMISDSKDKLSFWESAGLKIASLALSLIFGSVLTIIVLILSALLKFIVKHIFGIFGIIVNKVIPFIGVSALVILVLFLYVFVNKHFANKIIDKNNKKKGVRK